MTEAQLIALSSYLDGELDADGRREVEALLSGDAEAREYFAAMRAANATLKPAYADAIAAPAADPLRDALLRPREPGVVERLRGFVAATFRPPVLAACAAALVLGVAVGPLLGTTSGASQGMVYASNGAVFAGKPLAGLLQMARSGETTSAGVAQTSFRMKDGRYCRTFASTASTGLACKQGRAWIVDLLVSRPAAPQGDYTLAGDAPELAATLQRLGVGEVLDRDGEARAMASDWK